MLARRSLPDGYVLSGTVQLRGNKRLMLNLILLSIPWAFASLCGLQLLAASVRPQGWSFDSRETSPAVVLAGVIGGLLITVVVVTVVHEAVHGLLLWIITRSRPVFGYKGWYAYADSPGWYLPRRPMIATLPAPLVVLPAAGLPLIAYLPAGISALVLLGLWFNAIAAIGDLYMTWMALRIRGRVYFGDTPGAKPGEAGSWYLPV